MTTELLERETKERKPEEIIESMNWRWEEWRGRPWRPFTSFLLYDIFGGPNVRHGKGLDLKKNLVIYCDGARGGGKTLVMTCLLAKEMRIDKPVWTNYPISFFVQETDTFTGHESDHYNQLNPNHWINDDGTLSYYESMELNLDKFYTFDREIRDGAVGIDELQYFVEARTSGKFQNRVASYQLMQIRKTANSFLYTVQNPDWVDKRFGWSADVDLLCKDMSNIPIDHRIFGRELDEGEFVRVKPRDLSGIISGTQYKDTMRDLASMQVEAYKFWGTYPTNFIVDPEAAASSADNINPKNKNKKMREDRDAAFAMAMEGIISEDMAMGKERIASVELWDRIKEQGIEIPHNKAGEILRGMGILPTNNQNKYYSYGLIRQNQREV